ncbi:hypothetical protein [Pseudogemmobacter sonorensis]|uniref:hypothetical protein n=1 Tax=Pseudogemmobacter sonorensis TaxID=2989681 RepID=UPI00367F0019
MAPIASDARPDNLRAIRFAQAPDPAAGSRGFAGPPPLLSCDRYPSPDRPGETFKIRQGADVEVIDGPGIQIFLASQRIENSSVRDSVVAPGYWMGTLLEGEISVRQSISGERAWFGGGGTLFSSSEPVETRHRALSGGQMAAVFIRFDPALAPEILGEEAMAAFAASNAGLPEIARNLAWQTLACRMLGTVRRLYMGQGAGTGGPCACAGHQLA